MTKIMDCDLGIEEDGSYWLQSHTGHLTEVGKHKPVLTIRFTDGIPRILSSERNREAHVPSEYETHLQGENEQLRGEIQRLHKKLQDIETANYKPVIKQKS